MSKYFIFFLFIQSCMTPVQKLNKLLKDNPSLIKQDTILVKDTIIFPCYIFEHTIQYDTLLKEKEIIIRDSLNKVETKLIYRDGNIIVKTKIRKDTLIITKKVFVTSTKPIEIKKVVPLWVWIVFGFLFLFIIIKFYK